MNYYKLYTLLLLLSLCSCKKDKDENPSPAGTSEYNWYASALRSLDTLTVENGSLYYSAEGLNNINGNEQFNLVWLKGGLEGDFEMTITYEDLQSAVSVFNSPFNAPFGFFFYLEGNSAKQTNVSLGTNYTLIQYGNTNAVLSTDFKNSSSGTVVVKRTGSDFSISVTKDYLNGSTPAQFVQQKDMPNWFSGKVSFSFLVQNSLASQRSRIRWTSMSIKNAQGTVVETFDERSITSKL